VLPARDLTGLRFVTLQTFKPGIRDKRHERNWIAGISLLQGCTVVFDLLRSVGWYYKSVPQKEQVLQHTHHAAIAVDERMNACNRPVHLRAQQRTRHGAQCFLSAEDFQGLGHESRQIEVFMGAVSSGGNLHTEWTIGAGFADQPLHQEAGQAENLNRPNVVA